MPKNNNQLVTIQYLRGIAALMVVLHHARNKQYWLFNPLENYHAFAWGVDIFFVISGFIMYFAARAEQPFEFAKKRIIRVVPLYWLATFCLVGVGFIHQWTPTLESAQQLFKSLLFIPHFHPSNEHIIAPYLVPGWTLNYEIFFYFIFFLGLIFKRQLLLPLLAITLLCFTGQYISSSNAVVLAYTNPIMLEFLCGVLIANAYLNGYLKSSSSLMFLTGVFGLFSLSFFANDAGILAGRIVFSTMIVAGALNLSKSIKFYPLWNLIGDASYSIYLTHTVISLQLVRAIWSRLDFTGWFQLLSYLCCSLIVSTVVGIIVYHYVEKPMIRWLRSRW